MKKDPKIFEVKSYPILKIYEEHFEIKALDHWEFRPFQYSSISSIECFNPNSKWYNKIMNYGHFNRFFEDLEPSILRINLKNGGNWEYKCPFRISNDFRSFLGEISDKLK
ncbi:MAG: hypothetical protein H6599_01445 [Flavobacteriales bacterium]|nr:hypothetical protein [Flavobacteriales bacterium]